MSVSPYTPNTSSAAAAARFDALAHIRRAAIFQILASIAALIVCPFFLLIPNNADDFRLILIKYGVGIGGTGWALWNLIRHILYLNKPFTYPALQWTSHGTPQEVAAYLNREMGSADQHFRVGKATLTPEWLVRATPFALIGIPYSEIAWAYKKVTTRKAYGVVTVGRTYSLSVNPRSGKSILLPSLPETQVDAILQQIAARAPWAILGFNKETEAAWKNRRAEFLQTVAARHEYVRQQAASAAATATSAASSDTAVGFDLSGPASPFGPSNPW